MIDEYPNPVPIFVRKSEVPSYLQSGEFFESLYDDDNEQISVPSNTLKPDTTIENNEDLQHLLCSLRFWGVNTVQDEVVQYCLSASGSQCNEVLEDFAHDFPYIDVLATILPHSDRNRASLALSSGMLDLIQKLPQEWFTCKEATYYAAEAGHLHVLKYLLERGGECNSYLISAAFLAGENSLPIVKYLRSLGLEWPLDALSGALMGGSKECFHFALNSGCKWEDEVENDLASDDEQAENLRYALQHGCPLTVELQVVAAKEGAVQCLQVLHEMHCTWDAAAVNTAAVRGQLEALKFLFENGCPWNDITVLSAVSGNDLDCVQYVVSQGCTIAENCCYFAAQKGNIGVLQCLHEAGAYWDTQTCAAAAKYGHLNCLQYIFEHGCDISQNVCSDAAGGGHMECLQYAHLQGGSWNESICINATGGGHLQCLKYAHDHNAPWNKDTTYRAAEQGQLECLKYLLDNGCPVTRKAYQTAVDKGNDECASCIRAFAPQLFSDV